MRHALDRLATPIWWVMRKVYGEHPLRPERNALEFGLLVVMILGTFDIATGRRGLPNSLAETPGLFGQVAAALIVAGSIAGVTGLVWPDEDTRLLIEQLGLSFLAFGLLFYGAAVVSASDWDQARIAASMSWGVAAGAGIRFAHISWYYRQKPAVGPET